MMQLVLVLINIQQTLPNCTGYVHEKSHEQWNCDLILLENWRLGNQNPHTHH